jgi:hypothetical protein
MSSLTDSLKVSLITNLTEMVNNLEDDFELLPDVYDNAKIFIEKLPIGIEEPSLDIEDTGEILLEWSKREKSGNITIYSVVFSEFGVYFSLFKDGSRTNNFGHLDLSEESIKKIIDDINLNFI